MPIKSFSVTTIKIINFRIWSRVAIVTILNLYQARLFHWLFDNYFLVGDVFFVKFAMAKQWLRSRSYVRCADYVRRRKCESESCFFYVLVFIHICACVCHFIQSSIFNHHSIITIQSSIRVRASVPMFVLVGMILGDLVKSKLCAQRTQRTVR